jgi:flagellar motor switch protein FliG
MAESSAVDAIFTPRKLSGREKVAALLLAMGKPLATRVLKYFDEEEIRLLARSAAELGTVPRAQLDEIVTEFTGGIGLGSDVRGSIGEAEQLLSGVVSQEQLDEILSDVRGDKSKSVWPRLSQMPETPVSQFLSREHPQVAAFVLSKASPALAAAVLETLPPEMRNELMRRMLTLKHVMDVPLKLLENGLAEELLRKAARNSGQDIHARIADIINRMKRETMDEVFDVLNEYRPKEAEKVKALLFTFDDLVKLTPEAVMKVFDAVPPERTILALKGADSKLSDLILSSLGARNRRMIEQELASGVTPTQRDVLKARRAIADLVLQMAERGQIDLHPNEE